MVERCLGTDPFIDAGSQLTGKRRASNPMRVGWLRQTTYIDQLTYNAQSRRASAMHSFVIRLCQRCGSCL